MKLFDLDTTVTSNRISALIKDKFGQKVALNALTLDQLHSLKESFTKTHKAYVSTLPFNSGLRDPTYIEQRAILEAVNVRINEVSTSINEGKIKGHMMKIQDEIDSLHKKCGGDYGKMKKEFDSKHSGKMDQDIYKSYVKQMREQDPHFKVKKGKKTSKHTQGLKRELVKDVKGKKGVKNPHALAMHKAKKGDFKESVTEGLKNMKEPVRDPETYRVIEPAEGDCENCGNRVYLTSAWANECDKCGAEYNMSGQRLAPRSQWGEETGETSSDFDAADTEFGVGGSKPYSGNSEQGFRKGDRVMTKIGPGVIVDDSEANTDSVMVKLEKPEPEGDTFKLNTNNLKHIGEGIEMNNKKKPVVRTLREEKNYYSALRLLVGNDNIINARRAIQYALEGKSIPSNYIRGFAPIVEIVLDVLRGGPSYVQQLQQLDRRAKVSYTESRTYKRRKLTEGEVEKAELIMAAKDMVDRIQGMVEDLSKMKVEDLVALTDRLRDDFGNDSAQKFVSSVGNSLESAIETLTNSRTEVDNASQTLSGNEVTPIAPDENADDMGGNGNDQGMDLGTDELGADEFGSSDAAAGGNSALGRQKRESKEMIKKSINEGNRILSRLAR